MVVPAKRNLKELSNVTVLRTNGDSLPGINGESYDFAFSFLVFQHIPSYDVIRAYCREVYRVLKPGSLFKFQGQRARYLGPRPENDTWLGCVILEADARELAASTGFLVERMEGAGTQYFWLWFRKPVAGAVAFTPQ